VKEIIILCKDLSERGLRYNEIVRSKIGASRMYIYDGAVL
jgi:hypothetical protein